MRKVKKVTFVSISIYLDLRELSLLERALQYYKNLTEVNCLGKGKVKGDKFVGTALIGSLSLLTEVANKTSIG